jgi:hypothetical protein
MATTSFTKVSQRIPPIDYTSRDFTSISTDMVRTIPFFSPEWTDHNLSDFGIVLQRLVAFVSDVLHFYIDRNANEAFLPTAITRRSVINLLRLIDFELRSAVPASVDMTFSLQNALLGELLIPKGTQVQTTVDATKTAFFFETVADAIIPTGSLSVVVSAVEGTSISEDIGISTGLSHQNYSLTKIPVIDGTIKIYVNEGAGDQLWSEVDTLMLSREDDKVFVTERDEQDAITVFFGDNSAGKIPEPSCVIRAEYRVGGGINGNVGAHTITVVNGSFTYNSIPVVVTADNEFSASGGEDRMSIDEAKLLGPMSLRAMNRAVTVEDYEVLVELFPGIAKARVNISSPGCVDQNAATQMKEILAAEPCLSQQLARLNSFLSGLESSVGCCCVVNIIIAPRGGGVPSAVLKQSLLEYLDARKMVGTCIQLVDPIYAPIDIEGKVYVAANFDLDQVTMTVNDAIKGYFDLMSDYVNFGQPLYLSDFFHLVDAIPGVDHIDLTTITRRPLVTKEVGIVNCDFVHLDPTDLSPNARKIEVGETSKEEKWTVIFTSANTFTVRGTKSGLQQTTGETGKHYLSDKGEIGFTIDCPDPTKPPPQPMDRAGFETTTKSGVNVPIDAAQIMTEGKVTLGFIGGSRPQRVCQ